MIEPQTLNALEAGVNAWILRLMHEEGDVWSNLSLATLLALVTLLAGSISVSANQGNRGAKHSFAGVVEIGTGEVAGESRLTRNNNGITMNLETTGLEPGTGVSIWWVIFNEPEACNVPGECATPEHADLESGGAFYAAGTVVGGSGKAKFAARLPEGARSSIRIRRQIR